MALANFGLMTGLSRDETPAGGLTRSPSAAPTHPLATAAVVLGTIVLGGQIALYQGRAPITPLGSDISLSEAGYKFWNFVGLVLEPTTAVAVIVVGLLTLLKIRRAALRSPPQSWRGRSLALMGLTQGVISTLLASIFPLAVLFDYLSK